jgi:predicted nicotinamide N-methyase
MRFDHRNAVDVALHPESVEGQSVLNFLRQAGIPFIAFRAAVPGAATGAHIHIGKPSPRL